jgi:hypothetical protein
MPPIPSIKGTVFLGLVEDVQKLLAKKALKREELSRWLQPKDLAFVDSAVQPHEWYDIRVYARLSELLRDVEGKGKNEYLVKRGERSARRLIDGGLYSQLEYLQAASFGRKSDPSERFAAFGRDLARTTTLSASILNFSKWTAKPDPSHANRWLMEVSEAREYPETLAWATLGFTNELGRTKRKEDIWTWERPEPARIVFRMVRDP